MSVTRGLVAHVTAAVRCRAHEADRIAHPGRLGLPPGERGPVGHHAVERLMELVVAQVAVHHEELVGSVAVAVVAAGRLGQQAPRLREDPVAPLVPVRVVASWTAMARGLPAPRPCEAGIRAPTSKYGTCGGIKP